MQSYLRFESNSSSKALSTSGVRPLCPLFPINTHIYLVGSLAKTRCVEKKCLKKKNGLVSDSILYHLTIVFVGVLPLGPIHFSKAKRCFHPGQRSMLERLCTFGSSACGSKILKGLRLMISTHVNQSCQELLLQTLLSHLSPQKKNVKEDIQTLRTKPAYRWHNSVPKNSPPFNNCTSAPSSKAPSWIRVSKRTRIAFRRGETTCFFPQKGEVMCDDCTAEDFPTTKI